MQRHLAEVLLRDCFGYRDQESFLVVAEPECLPLAEEIATGARDKGYPASLLVIPQRARPEEEPPDFVADALRAADIALILTPHSLSATQAMRNVRRDGLRAAEICEFSSRLFTRLVRSSFSDISSSATALSGALEPGRRIHLRTPAGTDIEFVTGAERELRDGIVHDKGEFGHLPPGLARFSVEPGSFRGTIRADAWLPFPQLAPSGQMLRFEAGRLVEVEDEALRQVLLKGGEPPAVESVGFGLNAAALPCSSATESLLAAGTASVRLRFGPAAGAPLDVAFAGITGEVEGVPIPSGVLAPADTGAPTEVDGAPGEPAPAGPPPHRFTPEVFRLLFENSNDPMYVLDLEAQRFELVNDAFLRMSGYSRTRVEAGNLRVGDVVAEESKDRVEEKRAHRKQVSSERYDIRLKCADGTKKPVEVSVQRVKIEGREIVIGSLRDLTTHERMKRDLTERATDAMRKTLDIYALTEKIKNVPKLTPALLSGADEDDILAKAAGILTQKPGLSYASATVYLIEEHHVVQRFPRPGAHSGPARFDLSKGHRLARIARGEDKQVDWDAAEIAVPLPGRDGIIGVLEVTLDPKEAELMSGQGGHGVRTEYQNLLLSLAQILALSIENLRLYNVVKEQSETDQLTGVYNRRVFDRRLGDEVKRARRYGRDLTLLMIDLDHFKHVNDTYGHPKGDETLRHVARFLRIQSRGIDILARYGGDEFCLLLPECSLENAVQKAELLRKRFVTRKFSVVGRGTKAVRLTLSIGVGVLRDTMATEFDLLRVADTALYRSKGEGRNRVSTVQNDEGSPA